MKWLNRLSEAERVDRDNRQGLDKPYGSIVDTVSGDTEKVIVTNWATRGRELSLPHPFISSGAWIRAIPEIGAEYSTATRADDIDPMLISTIGKDLYKRVEAYRKGVGYYRPLVPGEIEISSRGLSQAYYATRPYQATRAGMLTREMSQDNLTISDRAPIHQRRFLSHDSSGLGDEHRIGLVSRPKNSWERLYPKLNGKFMAEEYISIANPSKANPSVLFTYQRGHVVDKAGTPIKQKRTSLPLRYMAHYSANDDTITSNEIDQNGNIAISLAQAATEGYSIDIPNGSYRAAIKKDVDINIGGNANEIAQGNWNTDITGNKKLRTGGTFSIDSNKWVVKVTSDISMSSASFKGTFKSEFSVNTDGALDLKAKAKMTASGTGGTDIGSNNSPTNVLGATIALAGGGSAVARLGDVAIGVGNLGAPVVSVITTGSPRVTSG